MGDADATEAQQASAARWGGVGFANELSQVLALALPLFPVDDRCSCACVSRAWREATAAPPLRMPGAAGSPVTPVATV